MVTWQALTRDGTFDHYEVTISSAEMINVERLIELTDSYFDQTIYQEHLTKRLYDELGIDGVITTIGVHSGVKVTATAGDV